MSVPRKQDGWRPGTAQDLEAMYHFKQRFRELKMLLELIESGKLDMKVIRGLLPPEMDSDAANKKYVDDGLAKTRPNTWNPSFLTDSGYFDYRNGLLYSGTPTNPVYMAVWDIDDSADGTQPNRRVRPISAEGARNLMGAAPAGYGLEATTRPPNNSLDELHTNGWYQCAKGYTGAPTGHGTINYGTVFAINRWGQHTTQFYVSQPEDIIGSPLMLVRNYSVSKGTWNPWEWINPPMVVGTEYRTTERCEGKPVYAKRISYTPSSSWGSATETKTLSIAHGASNFGKVVRISGVLNGQQPFPVIGAGGQILQIYSVTSGAINIISYKYVTSATVVFDLYYTKTTD